jgi:hypothetical protein
MSIESRKERKRAYARKYAKEYNKEHPEWRKMKLSLEKKTEKYILRNKNRRKNKRDEIKNQVFEHYGYRCVCCGEVRKEFLTLDHINGGGKKHKNEIGRGLRYLSWIIKNNFPNTYRILCMNCNFARGVYGYCPHEKEN